MKDAWRFETSPLDFPPAQSLRNENCDASLMLNERLKMWAGRIDKNCNKARKIHRRRSHYLITYGHRRRFLGGLNRVEKHVFWEETDLRIGAECIKRERASERANVGHDDQVVLLSSPRRKIDARPGPGTNREGSQRGNACGRKRRKSFRWHSGRLFIHPESSLLSVSFSQSSSLSLPPSQSLFLSPCRSSSLRARKARRSGFSKRRSVDKEAPGE